MLQLMECKGTEVREGTQRCRRGHRGAGGERSSSLAPSDPRPSPAEEQQKGAVAAAPPSPPLPSRRLRGSVGGAAPRQRFRRHKAPGDGSRPGRGRGGCGAPLSAAPGTGVACERRYRQRRSPRAQVVNRSIRCGSWRH